MVAGEFADGVMCRRVPRQRQRSLRQIVRPWHVKKRGQQIARRSLAGRDQLRHAKMSDRTRRPTLEIDVCQGAVRGPQIDADEIAYHAIIIRLPRKFLKLLFTCIRTYNILRYKVDGCVLRENAPSPAEGACRPGCLTPMWRFESWPISAN